MKVKTVVWFLVLILLLIFFLLGSFVSCFILPHETVKENMDYLHKYKILTYYPSSNETSLGVVTSFQEIGEEGFISFTSGGGIVMISRDDLIEYKCSGSCWCDEEESRRNNGVTTRIPMFSLIAAISSFVVIKKAEIHFQEMCVELSSHDEACKEATSVRSVVDFCKRAYKRIKGDDHSSDRNNFGVEYLCEGNCVPEEMILARIRKLEKQKDDQSLLTQRSLLLERINQCKANKLEGVNVMIHVPSEYTAPQRLNSAKIEFEKKFLQSFCEEFGGFSKEEQSILFEEKNGLKEMGSWCISHSLYNPYENIFCRPLKENEC